MSRLGLRARLGTGILILAALSLGRVLTDNLPGKDWAERAFTTDVAVGDTAILRTGTVSVTKVHGGTTVTENGSGLRTPGVWLVIDYTWTPSNGSEGLGSVAVRASGGQRWVALSGRNVQSCGASVPGLPVACHAAIEVPPDLAPGSKLELSPSFLNTSYDSMAIIDLGIDTRMVDGWLKITEPIDIPASELGAT